MVLFPTWVLFKKMGVESVECDGRKDGPHQDVDDEVVIAKIVVEEKPYAAKQKDGSENQGHLP